MKLFTEEDRYCIEGLTPDSLVIDGGAHQGNWGRLITEKYNCRVHFFEPIREFYVKMNSELAKHPQRPRMTLHSLGLGGTTRKEVFKIKGGMSGPWADGVEEEVLLLGIGELLSHPIFEGRQVGCLKLNVEGSEHEILEAILDLGLAKKFNVLHVQPHTVVPDYAVRWGKIKERLAATHELMWDEPWIWTGWKLRK